MNYLLILVCITTIISLAILFGWLFCYFDSKKKYQKMHTFFHKKGISVIAFYAIIFSIIGWIEISQDYENKSYEGIYKEKSIEYDNGYDDGWNDGWDYGWDSGWDSGWDEAWYDGYNEGYEEGLSRGKEIGYDNGYNEGYDDASY